MESVEFRGDHTIWRDEDPTNTGKMTGAQWFAPDRDGVIDPNSPDNAYPVAYTRTKPGEPNFLRLRPILHLDNTVLPRDADPLIRSLGPEGANITHRAVIEDNIHWVFDGGEQKSGFVVAFSSEAGCRRGRKRLADGKRSATSG